MDLGICMCVYLCVFYVFDGIICESICLWIYILKFKICIYLDNKFTKHQEKPDLTNQTTKL